jgi:glycosyltransferase involved in cell wall biosynthesis
MRIAVDARELCGRPTGVGRYLSELLAQWGSSRSAQRHEWTLYAHQEPPVSPAWRERWRVLPGTGGTVWEQMTLAGAIRRSTPDVLFAPGYTAPMAVSLPTVLTIHDVSYFAHPEWFGARERLRRRLITSWSARRARAVLTDSEFSRGEITRFVGVPASKVRVIPLGLRPASTAAGGQAVAPKARRPVVLYVGSVFERRRVDRLMACFDQVARRVPGARLEIVGENRTSRPRIDLEQLRATLTCRDQVAIRSYVDESTLADLYASASVFAFLSEYEGFGLTPLEALREGVAPVVLDTAVAREVCGNAARFVAPSAGQDEVAHALIELLTSPPAREAVLRNAPTVLARYDWARTADATLTALEEAAVA